MRRSLLLLPLLLLLAAGCASAPPMRHYSPAAGSFPAEGLLVQRALLTVHGRQFALNGYLALSPAGGKRLIVSESLGAIMADVLVKPDGKVYLMRPSRLPEKYVRRFLVPDLECMFGGSVAADCPVTRLAPDHFTVDRGSYRLDLRTVETKPGAQPVELFDETRAQ
jgi:hypothetical protein